ncbi:MAG TPA: hypothetical protein PKD63_11195, partial [Solirubrobacteraceae bacterium]|nr:hypothetical protein [Solirubrobacteraceae bacterium]
GRPEVFAALHDRLVRGDSLDALSERSRLDRDPADATLAAAFLARVLDASRRPAATPGLGAAHTLVGDRIVGGSLTHEDELVTLCAFPSSASRGGEDGAVARPSRRRLR